MRYGIFTINGVEAGYMRLDDSDPPKMLPGWQPVTPKPPTEEEYQEAYAEDWSFNTQHYEYLDTGRELLSQPRPPKPPTDKEIEEAYSINRLKLDLKAMYGTTIEALDHYPLEGEVHD